MVQYDRSRELLNCDWLKAGKIIVHILNYVAVQINSPFRSRELLNCDWLKAGKLNVYILNYVAVQINAFSRSFLTN